MQLATILMKIKTFFTKKKIIWTLVILLLLSGGWFIFGRQTSNGGILTDVVKRQDIQKTVLTTGQVVSATDLDLSFPASGVVKKVLVKEGDIVRAGQLLAEEDTSDLVAQLHNAEAGLTIAKQQAVTSKSNLANVTSEQDTLVANARRKLYSDGLIAEPDSDTQNGEDPIISGQYSGEEEGDYHLTFKNVDFIDMEYYGLEQGTTPFNTLPQPLGTKGLLVSFPGGKSGHLPNDSWTIHIPNKSGPNYTNNLNAYQSALQTRTLAIANAEANVGNTDPSSSVVDAQIVQAQANVDSITARIENAKIVAPLDGTITQVDTKIGELAQATVEAMKLLNVDALHTEALVSEADIASVAVGQSIDNTFDALGPDKHFTTTVLTVNPASTVISGVVNYKVTGSLEQIPEVKPGMTVNMTIKVAEKKNALVVPASAVINRDDKNFVRVINDPKKKTYTEVEVQTGLEADSGLTEITSGLNEGEEIVTYIK